MSDNNNKITQQSAFPRRDFLKYSAAAAAVAGAFSMGLPFGAYAAEATPKPGGVLRLGLQRIGLSRWIWHEALFDCALYVCVLAAVIAVLAH